MSRVIEFVALTIMSSSAIGSVEAQSIQVSPVMIELPPGATSSVVNVDTGDKIGVAIQARVFRWSQVGGEDKLEKTADIVVSPPVSTARSGASNTVRVVRVTQTPVTGQEAYRVFIEQIPDRKKLQAGQISLVIRQSIPVFVNGQDVRPGLLTWKAIERNGKFVLEAANVGQKRVKITKLTVNDDKNRELTKGNTAGYVLGGQTKAWGLSGATAGKTLTIKAESELGQINASITVGRSS